MVVLAVQGECCAYPTDLTRKTCLTLVLLFNSRCTAVVDIIGQLGHARTKANRNVGGTTEYSLDSDC